MNYLCSICSKVGHLQNVCEHKGKNVNNVDLNLNNLFDLESVRVKFVKPFCVKLGVNDISFDFQVDTGSAVPIMSKKGFEKFK